MNESSISSSSSRPAIDFCLESCGLNKEDTPDAMFELSAFGAATSSAGYFITAAVTHSLTFQGLVGAFSVGQVIGCCTPPMYHLGKNLKDYAIAKLDSCVTNYVQMTDQNEKDAVVPKYSCIQELQLGHIIIRK